MCCHVIPDGQMDDSDRLEQSWRSVGQGEVPTSSATGRWSGWGCGSLSTKWINQQRPCGTQKGTRRVTASFRSDAGSPFPQSSSFRPISPVSLFPQGESVSSLGCTEGESRVLPTHRIQVAGRRPMSAAPGCSLMPVPCRTPARPPPGFFMTPQ